jgi:hypothetical protein
MRVGQNYITMSAITSYRLKDIICMHFCSVLLVGADRKLNVSNYNAVKQEGTPVEYTYVL